MKIADIEPMKHMLEDSRDYMEDQDYNNAIELLSRLVEVSAL